MKWFRLYSELLHDPKVQRLAPALFKHWVNLLCLANESTPRGLLPPTEDVAFALRLRSPETARILAELHSLGLLDKNADDRYIPHNWPERQRNSDDVAARVRRHRNGTHDEAPPTDSRVDMLPVTLHEPLQVTGAAGKCNVLEEDTEEDKRKSRSEGSEPVTAPPAPTRSAHKVSAHATPKPRATAIPDDWAITDVLLEWWDAQQGPSGIDPAHETEKWQDYHRQKGTRVSDWAASWRNWMRKAIEFYQPPPTRNGSTSYAATQRQSDKLTSRLSDTAAFLAGLDDEPLEDPGRDRHPNVALLRTRATA